MARNTMTSFDTLFTRHSPPRVCSVGRSIFDPIWRETEHAGRHSELVHVLRGSFDLVMRDGTVHGREGDTLYTPAGMPHRDVFPPGSTFEVYLVHFDWDGERDVLRRFTPADLAARTSEPAKQQIAADFRALYRTFQQQGRHSAELTGLRLLQILLTLCSEADRATQARESTEPDHQQARRRQIMGQARSLIQQRFHERLGLDDIAEALGISSYHLSHVFSAESGFTLSSYLTSVRMEKAAELLRQARLNIGEVARSVGYRDPQYFSRVFGSHYGVAPSAYRARGPRQA